MRVIFNFTCVSKINDPVNSSEHYFMITINPKIKKICVGVLNDSTTDIKQCLRKLVHVIICETFEKTKQICTRIAFYIGKTKD